MNSKLRGKNTSASVSMITPSGVWVLVRGEEYFLRHKDFPWFEGAAVKDVMNVKMPHVGHLYWPELDVDLHVESLKNPEGFPLIASHNKVLERTHKVRRSA